jgi:hypothetical protein
MSTQSDQVSAEATRAETGRYASRNPCTPNFATFSGRIKYHKTQMCTKWSDDGEGRLMSCSCGVSWLELEVRQPGS